MGRPEFSQPGTQGGGQTVAVNNRPEPVIETVEKTSSLPKDTWETTEIFPPDGAVWTVQALSIRVDPDPDWTQGKHRLAIDQENGFGVSIADFDHVDAVEFSQSAWGNTATSTTPETESATIEAIHNMMADETKPLIFNYRNEADGPQDNPRQFTVAVKEVTY